MFVARAVLGIAGFLVASAAQALPLSFGFTGSVTDDPFGLSTFGAPISGNFTFDSTAIDSIAGASTGSFESTGPAFGFRATVDGTLYTVLDTLTVNTANNIGVDQYGVIASDGALTLELFFEDATRSALSSDALPLSPPAIAGFAFRQFRLFGNDVEFLGSVNSLVCLAGCSASSVPEPGSLPLAALALAAFVGARTRGRRHSDASPSSP